MRVSTRTVMASYGRTFRFAATAAICAALPGCGSFSKALGLEKSSPDEFAIVTKAPLVIPPDFSLRPPRPGAKRPQEQLPGQTASAALFAGQSARVQMANSYNRSRGETALLSKAGALEVDNSIRDVLASETTVIARRDRTFVDRILFEEGSQVGAYQPAGEPAPAAVTLAGDEVSSGQTIDALRASTVETQEDADVTASFRGDRFSWF